MSICSPACRVTSELLGYLHVVGYRSFGQYLISFYLSRPDLCQGPKKSEILGSLSPRSGTLMDLGPSTSFLSWDSGNPGPQNCDMPQDPGNPGLKDFDTQRDTGNPGPQNFNSRKTLETGRTLKLGSVAKPWKPRTQNLKILMSRDFKVLGPYTI